MQIIFNTFLPQICLKTVDHMPSFWLFLGKKNLIAIVSFEEVFFLFIPNFFLFPHWWRFVGSCFTPFYLLRIIYTYFLIISKALDHRIKLRLNFSYLVMVLGTACARLVQSAIILNIKDSQRRRISIAPDFSIFFIHYLHVFPRKRPNPSCCNVFLKIMRNL